MRNDVGQAEARTSKPLPAPPLVILATDPDGVCVDDLCLPADLREDRDEPEPAE